MYVSSVMHLWYLDINIHSPTQPEFLNYLSPMVLTSAAKFFTVMGILLAHTN